MTNRDLSMTHDRTALALPANRRTFLGRSGLSLGSLAMA